MSVSGLATTAFVGRTELISAQVREAITSGRLAPGQKLNLDDLAREFKVSRMPVRDALKVLESEGLVRIYPYRGIEVSRLTSAELEELFVLREILEEAALARAVPRLTEENLEAMAELLKEMDGLEDVEDRWFAANSSFHALINEASGWPRLLEMISVLRANAERYVRAYVVEEGRSHSQAQHWELFHACRARDSEAACDVIRRHLRDTATTLQNALSDMAENNRTDDFNGTSLNILKG